MFFTVTQYILNVISIVCIRFGTPYFDLTADIVLDCNAKKRFRAFLHVRKAIFTCHLDIKRCNFKTFKVVVNFFRKLFRDELIEIPVITMNLEIFYVFILLSKSSCFFNRIKLDSFCLPTIKSFMFSFPISNDKKSWRKLKLTLNTLSILVPKVKQVVSNHLYICIETHLVTISYFFLISFVGSTIVARVSEYSNTSVSVV